MFAQRLHLPRSSPHIPFTRTYNRSGHIADIGHRQVGALRAHYSRNPCVWVLINGASVKRIHRGQISRVRFCAPMQPLYKRTRKTTARACNAPGIAEEMTRALFPSPSHSLRVSDVCSLPFNFDLMAY